MRSGHPIPRCWCLKQLPSYAYWNGLEILGIRLYHGSIDRYYRSLDSYYHLLREAPKAYRSILATAVFTGLRQGELLGLRWHDVDFDAGTIHVRRQLDRSRKYVEPKTPRAVRSVTVPSSTSSSV